MKSALKIATTALFATMGHIASAQDAGTSNSQIIDARDIMTAKSKANDTNGGSTNITGASTQPGLDFDTSLLFYQESGSRVRAIEPVINITDTQDNGDVISGKLTFDAVTGPTPNGAAPATVTQNFVTPSLAQIGTTTTQTSGGSVTSVVNGLVTRTYSTPPGVLPVDAGFEDRRTALELGYTKALNRTTRLSFGGAGSSERDYTTFSGNLGIEKDVNNKNTTLALNVNFEYDKSRPFFGTPTAFTVMSAALKGPDDTKGELDVVAGVTQIMTRGWLTQLNYSLSELHGYQTDPYRIMSVVDPVSGLPSTYLYENRPRSRVRQSIYWGNKISLGPTFLDLSGRWYHDTWGITSITAEASDRIPISRLIYVEPHARYYHQTAANFFQYYLTSATALPNYATSDIRLGRF
ncbi:MAG: DUF3570 domain-containing protein, partial [Alphaproteobacteria bacterium]|nr:DUF3570 domain-containing protein [Alphaproteobacteria bacterium]